jgi:hypothetical protein
MKKIINCFEIETDPEEIIKANPKWGLKIVVGVLNLTLNILLNELKQFQVYKLVLGGCYFIK